MAFPPNFDHAWDLTQPPDTQLANLLGQDIRNLKDDVMQRMSLLSGTLANRPTPEIVNAVWGGAGFGLLYFASDTGQVFQWNGAAWVDVGMALFGMSPTRQFGGTRVVAAPPQLTGLTVATPSTIFYTTTEGPGIYRISVQVTITQVGTGGTIGPTLNWIGEASSIGVNGVQASTIALGQSTDLLGLANLPSPVTVYVANGTDLKYGATFSGVTGTPKYSLRARVEFLG